MKIDDQRSLSHDGRLTRRGSLLKFGGFLAAAVGASAWKLELLGRDANADAGTGPAAVASGAVACVLSPEMTEGPYYLPNEKVRRNITEGKPGAPLTLQLTVLDASTCRPIEGATVDIWHADAGGVYSGEQVEQTLGQTFLRGIQRTNASGLAIFRTIYPGWYAGRAVHIHVKVHVGGNVVHTGQFFFRDALTDAVYKRTPYSKRPNRDTLNANDSIYRNGGSRSILRVRRRGTGYLGTISMGVHRS